MVVLLSLVEGNAEQAIRQSVTVVVPPEHDSVDEEVLEAWVELIDWLVVDWLLVSELDFCVEVVGLLVPGSLLLSDLPSSSTTGGLLQSLNKGMQGISKLGRLGSSQTTAVTLGRPQITTGPPHVGHQITGTTVVEDSLPLVVVNQELAESPLLVINSVEKLSGTVVIVDVATEVPDTDAPDDEVVEDCVLWLVDPELVDPPEDVLLATVAVDCGEADVPVVLGVVVVVLPLLLHELVDADFVDVLVLIVELRLLLVELCSVDDFALLDDFELLLEVLFQLDVELL